MFCFFREIDFSIFVADPMTILENYDNNTSTDNSNNHRSSAHIKDRNQNLNQRQRRVPGDQMSNTKRKTRLPQQGRHRSVSVSSGDSDDEVC